MENVVIREARREDCKELRRLIQELADFEQMPDDCKLTVEGLERDGFDAVPPLFHCYVAEVSTHVKDISATKEENVSDVLKMGDSCAKLIGHALYFFSYSSQRGRTIYLEDIYVTPEYRGSKLGSALFDKVAKKGIETGCVQMDLVVLNWNPAQIFYKRKGATDITSEKNFNYYSIDRDAMEHLLAYKYKHRLVDTKSVNL
ncbi:thialysine N-epsilon-acetyltransferase-like [Schistocerca cancellata]|uniref:thialysine N-epsilon-acetyltransferase-like n=1 Tax=Schistocerca cancellata TaxID=274614 RepID=UPI00211825C3|nr:thialysine N-epsilon-acetyltransferase-like [Schistocerca cancellata]XP_049774135.1 thialysine N-epsilon-acetyltransferase-like [Schistocerca cancellata]XP_049774136.1 thialysine N-epsilon-acetyltransferase-like [Schistocerca cancellata]